MIRGIHEGFAKTKATDVDLTQMLLDEVTTITSEAELTEEVGPYLETLRDDSQDIGKALTMAKTSIEQFLAFVKTFEADEFYSIYCEREWRSVSTFNFTFDDVAMIVLPQRADGRDYFAPFVDGRAKALALPRGIPVVPWETLVES